MSNLKVGDLIDEDRYNDLVDTFGIKKEYRSHGGTYKIYLLGNGYEFIEAGNDYEVYGKINISQSTMIHRPESKGFKSYYDKRKI